MCHHYQCVSVRTSSEKIFQKQGKKQQTRNDCCQHFYDRVKVCFLRYFFFVVELSFVCHRQTDIMLLHCDCDTL